MELADARSGSPMETRLRLLLVLAGLPRPEVQWVVQDPAPRGGVVGPRLSRHRVGIEYEGGEHTRPDRVLRDIGRAPAVDLGWRVYRFTKLEIYTEPDLIVAEVRRGPASRGLTCHDERAATVVRSAGNHDHGALVQARRCDPARGEPRQPRRAPYLGACW